MSNLGLNDKMPFGKFSGSTIESIYKEQAEYLVWLRAERKKTQNDTTFFNDEVSTLLDLTIQKDKNLRRKFEVWGTKYAKVLHEAGVKKKEEAENEETREVAYKNEWGQF